MVWLYYGIHYTLSLNFLTIGLDYRTLRDELQAGARLPNPTYSSPKISHLIQTCWLADPIERPTFTKIKSQLRQSSEISISNIDRVDNDYLTLLSDNSMYRQYKMIQESNLFHKYISLFCLYIHTIMFLL